MGKSVFDLKILDQQCSITNISQNTFDKKIKTENLTENFDKKYFIYDQKH